MAEKVIATHSKARLAWLMIPGCALSILLFASVTASLYLPHKNIWWSISESVLAGMMLFSAIQGYRRRKRRKPDDLHPANAVSA